MKKIFPLFTLFLIPDIVLGYTSLVPSSPIGAAASSLNLQSLLKTMYVWGVNVAVALAILFIIFGGIEYMTTDSIFKKEEGKKRVTAAVAGLLIVFASWLILNQINPKIFVNDLSLNENLIQGSKPLDTGGTGTSGSTSGTGSNTSSGGSTETNGKTSSEVIGDESSIRSSLAQNGVTVNKNPCTYSSQTDCTNTAGFKKSTVDAISTISKGTGGFVITAGTESGHAIGTYSHSTGYKFDIGQGSNSSKWDTIDSYFKTSIGSQNISNNTTYSITTPSTGQKMEVRRETTGGLHWDIKALP